MVELDPAGKIAAQHRDHLARRRHDQPSAHGGERQGRRYFVGFTGRDQQLFLFDETWKLLLRYPEGTHAGIFDVQLADWTKTANLTVVGYAGSVGVQNVSLRASVLWSNRTLDNVISVAVLDPAEVIAASPGKTDGHFRVWCANERPAIAVLDYQGKSLPDIPVLDRPVDVLVTARLSDSQSLDIAALASPKPAELVALGLDRLGHELWNYALPSRCPEHALHGARRRAHACPTGRANGC